MINVAFPNQALYMWRVWERFRLSPHQGRGPTGPFLQHPVQPHYDTSRVRGESSQPLPRDLLEPEPLVQHQASRIALQQYGVIPSSLQARLAVMEGRVSFVGTERGTVSSTPDVESSCVGPSHPTGPFFRRSPRGSSPSGCSCHPWCFECAVRCCCWFPLCSSVEELNRTDEVEQVTFLYSLRAPLWWRHPPTSSGLFLVY